jgi:hypothetical protein
LLEQVLRAVKVSILSDETQEEFSESLFDARDEAVANAEAAGQSAANSQASADASAASASASQGSANASQDAADASQASATASADSATASRAAADDSEASAQRAEDAVEQLQELTVSAASLTSGSEATAVYTFDNNHIAFGIPIGDKGDKGDMGETGYLPPPSSSVDEDNPDQYASSRAIYALWQYIKECMKPVTLWLSGGPADRTPARWIGSGGAGTVNTLAISGGGAKRNGM